MRIFTHTIWISRSPDAVFTYFTDWSMAPRWRMYVRSMTPRTAGPIEAGSVIDVVMDVLGETYRFDLTVLECKPPHLWRHRSNETEFHGFVEYRFDAERGGTRVTMTMHAKPTGLYGWLALPMMLLRGRKPYAEQLPQLKRVLEGQS